MPFQRCPVSHASSFAQSLTRLLRSSGTSRRLLGVFMLGSLWLGGGNGTVVFAQSPTVTPNQAPALAPVVIPDTLRSALQSLDQAASQENLEAVLQYYSPTFQDEDGLTRSSLAEVFQELWQRYDPLTYETKIIAATSTPEGWILETVTHIEGMELTNGRSLRLNSEIRARQTWQNHQLVSQAILTERNVVTTGQQPPTLTLNLPTEVQVNERFHLDVIVAEPLGEDLIVGAIVDEPIGVDRFLNPEVPTFEPLLSGGIFKMGRAPDQPDQRWISAVIIRKGGMTTVTQRLRIVD